MYISLRNCYPKMIKKLHFQYLILLFLLPVNCLFSQEKVKQYSVEQGLSNYKVQSIFKDSDGFIWVGTEDGLNRFDGNNFTVYRNNPKIRNSISLGNILKITQGKNKLLWIAFDGGGVNIMNPITGKIRKIFHKANPKYPNIQHVKDVYLDHNQIAWISSWGGLIKYDSNKNTFKHFKHEENDTNSLSSTDVKQVVEDKEGILWIATRNGLNSFDPETNKFTRYQHNPNKSSVGSDNIRKLFVDTYGILWVAHDKGITTYEKKKDIYRNHIINDRSNRSNLVNSFCEDEKGKLWLATEEGIFSISSIYGQLKTHPFQFLRINTFVQFTNNIFRDRNGIIWFGTSNSGMYSIDLKPSTFFQVKFDSQENGNKEVKSIVGNSINNIWFGSSANGLINYNTVTQKYQKFLNKTYISEGSIESIIIDKNNCMWIGTYSSGLFHLNLKTDVVTPLLETHAITNLFETKYGTICIGTSIGLKYYNRESLKPIDNVFKHTLDDDHVYFIFQDKDGIFWTGSMFNGLCSYDVSNHTITKHNLTVKNNFLSCMQDSYGNLWFATRGGGLVKRTPEGKIAVITKTNGLLSNNVSAIIEDKKNNIWVSSKKGISVLKDGKTNVIKNYNKRDGLASYEYHAGACYKDTTGNLYFGGSEGIDYFHPDSIKNETYRNKIIISKINIFGKEFISDTVTSYKKKLELDYDQNFISIKFNTIDYIAPEKQQYYYKLVGIDKDWVHAFDERSVTYANLLPNDYKFVVKAFDSNPTIKGDSKVFTISIAAPFWETWWFISLSVLLTASLITFFAKARINKLITDKETAQFKLLALRSQMNPHFIFNSLNSIQHFIISKENNTALIYLSKFSKLVRKILENSAENKIALSEEISFLKNYIEIESLRFDHGLDYEFIINEEEVNPDITEIPSMLIQPYVENSIIHGLMNKNGKGKITIEFKAEKHILKCIITDNGIGREKAREIKSHNETTHKSMGISITKNRLDVLNKSDEFIVTVSISDVYLEDKSIGGTQIEIIIPID